MCPVSVCLVPIIFMSSSFHTKNDCTFWCSIYLVTLLVWSSGSNSQGYHRMWVTWCREVKGETIGRVSKSFHFHLFCCVLLWKLELTQVPGFIAFAWLLHTGLLVTLVVVHKNDQIQCLGGSCDQKSENYCSFNLGIHWTVAELYY